MDDTDCLVIVSLHYVIVIEYRQVEQRSIHGAEDEMITDIYTEEEL